jgi:hypothetical protein
MWHSYPPHSTKRQYNFSKLSRIREKSSAAIVRLPGGVRSWVCAARHSLKTNKPDFFDVSRAGKKNRLEGFQSGFLKNPG